MLLHLQDLSLTMTGSARPFRISTGRVISARTIQLRLHTFGLYSRWPYTTGQRLPPFQRLARLNWANRHIQHHLFHWDGVLFSDEPRLYLYHVDRRARVCRCQGERLLHLQIE